MLFLPSIYLILQNIYLKWISIPQNVLWRVQFQDIRKFPDARESIFLWRNLYWRVPTKRTLLHLFSGWQRCISVPSGPTGISNVAISKWLFPPPYSLIFTPTFNLDSSLCLTPSSTYVQMGTKLCRFYVLSISWICSLFTPLPEIYTISSLSQLTSLTLTSASDPTGTGWCLQDNYGHSWQVDIRVPDDHSQCFQRCFRNHPNGQQRPPCSSRGPSLILPLLEFLITRFCLESAFHPSKHSL